MLSKQSGNSAATTIERLIVDASVAAKWFLEDEPDIDLANNLLAKSLTGKIEFHAPNPFHYEIDGALTRACLTRLTRGGPPRLSVQDALDALERLSEF